MDGVISSYVPVIPEKAHLQFRVKDYHLDYETDDHTGLIRGRWLEVNGVLRKLKVQCLRPPTNHACGDWGTVLGGTDVSEPHESAFSNWQLTLLLDFQSDEVENKSRMGNLYCMPTQALPWWEGGRITMLIPEVVNEDVRVHRRVGIALGWGDRVKRILEDDSKDDYSEDYGFGAVEQDGSNYSGLFTILKELEKDPQLIRIV